MTAEQEDIQASINEERAEVRRRVVINAPRGVVWAALTEPAQIGRWFGQRADFPDGVAVGALGSFGWDAHGEFPARIETFEPQTRFAFTWGTSGAPIRDDNSTTAHFDLVDVPAGTQLSVVETGFDTLGAAAGRRAAMEDNAQGWIEELEHLEAHVEDVLVSGKPVADLEAGVITRTLLINTEIEGVWSALTTPAAIESWWGHPARFEDGIQAGSTGTFEWVGHGFMPMRVERCEQPVKFSLRWGALGDDEPGPDASLVEFTLTRAGDRTVLTMVESGFTDADLAERRGQMEDNVSGWTIVLDALSHYVSEVAA